MEIHIYTILQEPQMINIFNTLNLPHRRIYKEIQSSLVEALHAHVLLVVKEQGSSGIGNRGAGHIYTPAISRSNQLDIAEI